MHRSEEEQGNMRASDSSLGNFLASGASFRVPVFQRNYSWDERMCERLFRDVEALAARRVGGTHFFGSFVYSSCGTASRPEFLIVDGQQRLASIALLIRALEDEGLSPSSASSGRPTIRLKQTKSDSAVYEKILLRRRLSEDSFLPEERESLLYGNYVLFRRLVSESRIPPTELYSALRRFEIIDALLEDENPQEVFESMNSTGTGLTGADLLRNRLLMGLGRHEQDFLYENYWVGIEDAVGPNMLETFLLDYLIMKLGTASVERFGRRIPLNGDSLYSEFCGWLDSLAFSENDPFSETEALLSDMLFFSEQFRRIFRNDGKTPADAAFRELTGSLSGGVCAVFLMHLMGSAERLGMTEADLADAAEACVSYVFRVRILKGTVSAQFFALAVRRFEESDPYLPFRDRVWTALTRGGGSLRFPRDREFMETLNARNLYVEYRPSFVRYALYKYEKSLTREVVEDEDVTVEHILPQNCRRWARSLAEQNDDEYPDYIHKIGNLTLTKYNGELSDSPFEEKRRIYADSGFGITRRIAENAVWNSASIKERTKRMAQKALDLWPMPDRYNYWDYDCDPFDSYSPTYDDGFEDGF